MSVREMDALLLAWEETNCFWGPHGYLVASGKKSRSWQTTSSHGYMDLKSANHRELREDQSPR